MTKKKQIISKKTLTVLTVLAVLIIGLLGWNYFVVPFNKVKLSTYIPEHSLYCLANGPQCGCPEGGKIVRDECYVDKATAERLAESFK